MNNQKRKFRFKILYWVLGIFVAVMVFMAGLHFWDAISSPISNTNASGGTNSSSSSGTGGNTHNPGQEIQKHLKQMGI